MGTVYARGKTPERPGSSKPTPSKPRIITKSGYEHEVKIEWMDKALMCSPIAASLITWAFLATHNVWVLAACLVAALMLFAATIPQHRRLASKRRIRELEWQLGIGLDDQ